MGGRLDAIKVISAFATLLFGLVALAAGVRTKLIAPVVVGAFVIGYH